MSNVLDDNVVILRFDNSDFEKNTKQSMDTLDKLKNSVSKTSGESLDGLSKAANSVNLSGLGKAIDTINNRFSNMGIIGMAAINKLTSSAMSSVANIATAVPRQMIQGGWKRALNIEKAEYLMKGLGVAFEGSFTAATDKTKEKIEGIKGAVLASVNDTRYGLDEAAKAAATLIASDEKLKDNNVLLADRLKAISGVAAVTSSEFSDISYIFTKVAGQGRMMTNELNMLSMKGFNAAVEIQKYLNTNKDIKDQALQNAIALGKQTKKMEEIGTHAELTEADVRDMVSAGAISFDVMSDSLQHFFETASGANSTYEGSLANVKAAFSRMGAQVEATKLKNLTKIFNFLLPVLKKFEKFIEPFTAKMNDFSNKVTDFIGEGILNPLGKAMGMKNKDLFHGFAEAADDAAKGIDKANKKNQKITAKTKKEILALNKEYQASRDIWYKGTYGNGARRKNALEQLGISYKETQKIINQFYADGFKWDKIENQLVKDYKERNKASDDAASKTVESNEKQIKQYPTMVALVKSFVNLLASAKLTIEGFKNIVVSIGKSIKTMLAPGVNTGVNLFERLTEKILAAARRFKEFSEVITDTKKRTEWMQKHTWVSSFTSAISTGFDTAKTIITGFIETIKEFFSKFSESEGFGALKEQIKDLLGVLKDLGGSVLGKVTGQLEKLSGIGSSSNMDKIVNFFSKISGGLADMIEAVKRGENPLKNFTGIFSSVKDALSFKSLGKSAAITGVGSLSAKNGLVGSISEASKTLKNAHVTENFSKATDSVVNFIVGLSGKAKNLNVQESLVNLFDKIKNVNWSEVSKIALHFGSLFGIIASVKSMRNITDAAVGTFGSISGLFKSLSDLTNTYAKKIKVAYFATIATSVAILAGCMVALALIPTDKLIPAMAGILAAMGALVGVTAILSSDKFDADKVKKIGIGFAAMGASLALLAVACKIIAGIDGGGLMKAGVTILAFIGIFALASKIIGESTGAGKSFMALAGAIDILVISLVAFAAMPWGMLLKGVAMIGIVMLELVVATRIAGTAQPKGFVGMANAINILLPAITAFSLMPFGKAMKGATIVSLIIAMLGVASRTASENAKSFGSIAALSVMIGTMAASLVVLSMIDTGKLAASTLAMTTVVTSLAVAAKFAEKSTKGLLSLSLIIGVIAGAIITLIEIDAKSAIDVANSLAILAASLGVAFGIFSKIGVKGSLVGLGGLTIAVDGITAVIMSLGAIRQIPGATWLLGEGKKFAQQLGDAIGSFFGSIVSGFGVAATSGLGAMADNISDFSEKIQPFLTMVQGIDATSVQGAKDLADSIYQLTKADFVESLSVFSGVENLATRMEELGTGFVKFSEAVDQVPPDTAEKSAKIAEIIKTLATSFNKIPKSHGAEQLFSGVVDIDLFVKGMLKIANALGDNGDLKKGLSELDIPDDLLGENGKITKIAGVIAAMSSAMKKMPKTGGAEQLFTGYGDLSGMADGIINFAVALGSKQEGLQSLATIVIPDGLTAENGPITKICQVIAALSEAVKLIPESGGIEQAFVGNTTINEFAYQLANSIPALSKFITAMGSNNLKFDGDVKDKILRVAEAVGAMATASQKIPDVGGIKTMVFGGKDISDFANKLSEAIPGLQDFATGIGSVNFGKGVFGDSGKLSKVVEAVSAMAKVSNALPKSKGWAQKLLGEKDLGNFGKQLSKLMSSLSEVGSASIDAGAISSAASALETIVPAIKTFKGAMPIPTGSNLVKLGQNALSFTESMGKANTKGIGAKANAIKNASTAMGKAAGDGAKSLGKTAGFSSAGTSLVNDFVKGLKGKVSSAKSAGASLAKSAKSGAGSVSLNGVGKDVGQGFVNGINSKKQAAYNSGSALGYKAKAGAKNAVNSNSPAKEFIKIGKFVGEGFVLGMQAYERKVYKQGEDVGEMSIAGTRDGIVNTMGGLMDPVITPVIDLSKVDRGLSAIDSEFSRNRAIGINSTFENANDKNAQMMNDVVNAMNKMNDNKQPTSNYFTFNVDGAENPEDFAKRFVRQVQLEMRTG